MKDGIRKQFKKAECTRTDRGTNSRKDRKRGKKKAQREEKKMLEKKICVLQNKLKLPLTPHAHWERRYI